MTSKCYYCNNQSRGCPECRDKQPTWVLVHPLSEASEQLAKVPRHPIKDDRAKTVSIADASWEEQLVWLGAVESKVKSLDSRITLELLREINPFRTALISRTTFENQPVGKQHRVQQWIVNNRDMFKSPDSTAQFIVDYWKRRRAVADGTLVAPAASYPTALASFLANTTSIKLDVNAVGPKTVDAWKNGVWTDNIILHEHGHYSSPIAIPETQLQIHDEISYEVPFDKISEVIAKIRKYWDKRMHELLVDCVETCKVDQKIEKKFDGTK